MKYKCVVCGKKIEANDCVLDVAINLSMIEGKEIGDLIYSPIYDEKICGWCAEHLSLIFTRGMEKIKELEKD